MPEVIFLEISRKKIEACDTTPVLERLRQLTADRDTVLAGKGRLFLLIGGYDNDARAAPDCRIRRVHERPHRRMALLRMVLCARQRLPCRHVRNDAAARAAGWRIRQRGAGQ